MEEAGLGHIPNLLVQELEAVSGLTFPAGYNKDIRPMYHLW